MFEVGEEEYGGIYHYELTGFYCDVIKNYRGGGALSRRVTI